MATYTLDNLVADYKTLERASRLTVLQTQESFDWEAFSGAAISTVSDPVLVRKYSCYDKSFGLNMVHPDKLIALGEEAFTCETCNNLKYEKNDLQPILGLDSQTGDGIESSNQEDANFLKLKDSTHLTTADEEVSLGGYRLALSDIVCSIGQSDDDTLTKSIRASLVNPEWGERLSLLYTEKARGKETLEQRLYFSEGGEFVPIDIEKNRELVLLALTIEFLHKNKLKPQFSGVFYYSD